MNGLTQDTLNAAYKLSYSSNVFKRISLHARNIYVTSAFENATHKFETRFGHVVYATRSFDFYLVFYLDVCGTCL